jgi:hypothetical protein
MNDELGEKTRTLLGDSSRASKCSRSFLLLRAHPDEAWTVAAIAGRVGIVDKNLRAKRAGGVP